MFFDKFTVKVAICFWTYLRKASLFQRPAIMIVIGCVLMRTKAIAKPDRIE